MFQQVITLGQRAGQSITTGANNANNETVIKDATGQGDNTVHRK